MVHKKLHNINTSGGSDHAHVHCMLRPERFIKWFKSHVKSNAGKELHAATIEEEASFQAQMDDAMSHPEYWKWESVSNM
jgi:hypothetical protein